MLARMAQSSEFPKNAILGILGSPLGPANLFKGFINFSIWGILHLKKGFHRQTNKHEV